MKRIYVAHPLRGCGLHEEELNRQKVTRICTLLSIEQPDLLLFSPIHNYSYIPAFVDQTQVLSYCRKWLEVCDELWVYGDWRSSEGCVMEVMMAELLGKVVVYKDGTEV